MEKFVIDIICVPLTSNSEENVTALQLSGSLYPPTRVIFNTTLSANATSSNVNDTSNIGGTRLPHTGVFKTGLIVLESKITTDTVAIYYGDPNSNGVLFSTM